MPTSDRVVIPGIGRTTSRTYARHGADLHQYCHWSGPINFHSTNTCTEYDEYGVQCSNVSCGALVVDETFMRRNKYSVERVGAQIGDLYLWYLDTVSDADTHFTQRYNFRGMTYNEDRSAVEYYFKPLEN